jgi:hypothetical protein
MMNRIPKRLVLVAILLFFTVGVCYANAILRILDLCGYSDSIWNYGWIYFHLWFFSGIGIACFSAWSLLTFRPLGRWLALGLFCAVPIFMLLSPWEATPFYTKRQIMINRCIFFLAPFVCAACYLLSRSFRRVYSAAQQERQSSKNVTEEESH